MKILHCEASYDREDEAIFLEKAFKLAGFTKEEASETIDNGKEVKYILGDKIVRFLKYEKTSYFPTFYCQYHVFQLTDEDKEIPKKIFSSKKSTDVKTEIKKTVEKPQSQKVIEKSEIKDTVMEFGIEPKVSESEAIDTPEKKDASAPTDGFFTEEDISGDALQKYLEDNGQQTLFDF